MLRLIIREQVHGRAHDGLSDMSSCGSDISFAPSGLCVRAMAPVFLMSRRAGFHAPCILRRAVSIMHQVSRVECLHSVQRKPPHTPVTCSCMEKVPSTKCETTM